MLLLSVGKRIGADADPRSSSGQGDWPFMP